MFDKKLTPKAQRYRKRQLERMGFDEDRIRDILDYEFELKLGRYPRSPLPGKKYEDGGAVTKMPAGDGVRGSGAAVRGTKFKGVF